jgi:hypothetical protein
MTENLPMPIYSIDRLYSHWFRCEPCGQDVAEVPPAEAKRDVPGWDRLR